MIANRIFFDDQRLVDLYQRFQHARQLLCERYAGVIHNNFIDDDRYEAQASIAAMIAAEHILASSNMVNRFCYDMHALQAWTIVFESLDEDEKFIALFEFVSPPAADCLSMPYSARQIFIKSICQISHQTNRFRTVGWSEAELKPDRKLQFEDAKRLSADFRSWPAFCDALSRLNDTDFAARTDDYRNRLNHGFPRRIELGHTMTIRRDPDPRRPYSFVYKIYDAPPLRIGDLISLLSKSLTQNGLSDFRRL